MITYVNNLTLIWDFIEYFFLKKWNFFWLIFGLATNCTIKDLIACDMRPCLLLNKEKAANCWYKYVIIPHWRIIDIMFQVVSKLLTCVNLNRYSQDRCTYSEHLLIIDNECWLAIHTYKRTERAVTHHIWSNNLSWGLSISNERRK